MSSGKIDIIKTIETRVNGKPIKSDELFYKNCWCELLQLYGTELYEAINVKLENTLVFKVRYCKLLEQLQDKSEYKVVYNNRVYKIYYSDFSKYYKKHVLLKCNLIS